MDVDVFDNATIPMSQALIEGLRTFSEAYIASAFITGPGLEWLLEELTRFASARRHRLTLVTGDYLGFTSADVLDRLRQLERDANGPARSQRVRVKYIRGNDAGAFHPKVYLFMGGGQALLLLGSGNLTSGGVGGNIEAYVSVSGGSRGPLFQAAKDLILHWGGLGECVTDGAISEQKDAEKRRTEREEMTALLGPVLTGETTIDPMHYLRLCEFVRRAASLAPLPAISHRVLSAARAGRVVDLHLSHGGLWLPLPPEWFNADRKTVRSDKITTVTKVDYYLFGRQAADRLRKLENRVDFGISDYGWRTRRGVFVPDSAWDGCRAWFESVRRDYEKTATAAIGPERGRNTRAERSLRDDLTATWQRHNRGKPLPRGLVGDTRALIRQRLDDIAVGRRQPWRFEMGTLPHPVVAWAAMPVGLSGSGLRDSDIADELSDFALANLQLLAKWLSGCIGAGPKACRRIADALTGMNTIGFQCISRAEAELSELVSEREAGSIGDAAWSSRRGQLARVGTDLSAHVSSLGDEPSDIVLECLSNLISDDTLP